MPEQKILIYPRGFMSMADPDVFPGAIQTHAARFPEKSPGDKAVEELFKLYISRTVNSDSWQYRKRVVATASRLFGDFKTWITLQAGFNDYVYGLNFDFLLDTWQFIRTGHRDMSPMTWQDLLLEHQESKLNVSNPDRLTAFKWDDMKSEEIIGRWCSHDNGFGDMLCAMHTIFGVARIPANQQITP